MKFGYSEKGRVFMFEKTPSVVKLSGIHLEKISKVRDLTELIYCITLDFGILFKCLKIKFTTANSSYGGSCGGEGGASHYQSQELELSLSQRGEVELAMVTISLPLGLEHHSGQELYYICVQAGSTHQ